MDGEDVGLVMRERLRSCATPTLAQIGVEYGDVRELTVAMRQRCRGVATSPAVSPAEALVDAAAALVSPHAICRCRWCIYT